MPRLPTYHWIMTLQWSEGIGVLNYGNQDGIFTPMHMGQTRQDAFKEIYPTVVKALGAENAAHRPVVMFFAMERNDA